MHELRETTLQDILGSLPDVVPIGHNTLQHLRGDLFLCALGFEERCPWITEFIARCQQGQFGRSIYIEYPTNIIENDANKQRLCTALEGISGVVEPLPWDPGTFPARFRDLLRQEEHRKKPYSVVFDISSCSSSLLMQALTILLGSNCALTIVYSEAAVYHPTIEEYRSNPSHWIEEDGFGLAKGVGRVILSAEHPGIRSDAVAEAVVLFPTFNPDRVEALLTAIDESLSNRDTERICWILGRPHLNEDYWRVSAMRQINKIAESWRSYEVSTFDYRETMSTLEAIIGQWGTKYNVTIAPLGSKLQCVGTALFWYIHQEVSLALAFAERYNAKRYSEGCKAMWQINFGDLTMVREQLNRVGQLQIID